jgi:hypothetical protein
MNPKLRPKKMSCYCTRLICKIIHGGHWDGTVDVGFFPWSKNSSSLINWCLGQDSGSMTTHLHEMMCIR